MKPLFCSGENEIIYFQKTQSWQYGRYTTNSRQVIDGSVTTNCLDAIAFY
jgi:hypothetical protein